MNDKNKSDLSIEMYEDLKETLVKAIKNYCCPLKLFEPKN